jgi:hypothetical protein
VRGEGEDHRNIQMGVFFSNGEEIAGHRCVIRDLLLHGYVPLLFSLLKITHGGGGVKHGSH